MEKGEGCTEQIKRRRDEKAGWRIEYKDMENEERNEEKGKRE